MNSHHLQTNTDTESLLADVVDEITQRLNAGETVNIEEYASRFPDMTTLARVFETLMLVRQPVIEGEMIDSNIGSPPQGQLGDFRILGELGRGGMGVVYEAEQSSLGRRMALKVLPFAAMLDRQQLKRFKNEARAAATLDHPNIVAVHSVGEDRGVHYYAMQLIEGQSLAELIADLRTSQGIRRNEPDRQGGQTVTITKPRIDPQQAPNESSPVGDEAAAPLVSPSADTRRDVQAAVSTVPTFDTREYFRTAARLGIDAARALDHAHQNGVLHRDVKPGNLMVDSDGKLWVTDFGLARIEADAGMTMTGNLLGTLAYMSPEQALAKRVVVDHRTDIYSLGVTLYELLALRLPYAGVDRQELLKNIAFEEPRRLRQVNRRIPEDLETIVSKAIEKSPADRYATAQELADDLQRFFSDEPIKASPPNLRQRVTKWSRRNPGLVTGAMAVLLLLLLAATVGTALVWREKVQTQAALDQVREQKMKAEESAAQSKALVDFFVDDLLGAVYPERALGEKVTVEEVVAEAERKIDSEPIDQPLLEAVIRSALGKIHRSLGDYKRAEHQLRRALETQQRLLGTAPETLETMSQLAATIRLQQRPSEARALHEKTLDLKRRVLGPDHPDTLREMREVGVCLVEQGRFDDSQKVLEQTVTQMQRILGRDDLDTLEAKHDLACMLIRGGQYDRGRQLTEETVESVRRIWGEEHPQALWMSQNLANLHADAGDYEAAQRQYQEILAARRRIYGPIHPKTLETFGSVVEMLASQGDYDAAFKMQDEVIENLTRELGGDHPRTLSEIRRRANLLTARGEWDESQRALEGILEITRRKLGPEHSDTVAAMRDLAKLYATQLRWDDARKLHEQRFEILRRVEGPESENASYAMHDLAKVIFAQGKLDEARDLYEETIAIKQRLLGPEHMQTLVSMHGLAEVLRVQGEYERSVELYRQVIETKRQVLGAEHRETLVSMHELAVVYDYQGNHQDALPLKQKVFETFRRMLGPESRDTLTVMGTLAMTHHALGHNEQAESLFRELIDAHRDILGANHPDSVGPINKLQMLLSEQGKHKEAAELNELALEIARKAYGEEHDKTWACMHNLACNYMRLHNYNAALPLFEQSNRLMRRDLGDDHPTTLENTRAFAHLLRRQEKYAEARALYEEALERARRVFGPEDSFTFNVINNLATVYTQLESREEMAKLRRDAAALIAAHYRAGRWREATAVGPRMPDVNVESRAEAQFYVAMSHWRLDNHNMARRMYAQAVEAMGDAPESDELTRLRDEAASLLKAEDKKPTTDQPD